MPIDWLTLAAALLSGILGGAHCAVMCGGIATGFSAMAQRGGWAPALEANLGRVGGYVLAGLLAGGIGHGVVRTVSSEWLILASRMLVGVVMIIVALRLLGVGGRSGFLMRSGSSMWALLRPLHARLMPANTRARRIGLGALWGWLPCGLSSTVLIAAWLQASALNGGLTMAAFGLGTLPVMLPLTWSGARLGLGLRSPGRRATLAILILLAGVVTVIAPWLMQVPFLHSALAALGCLPLPG